MTIQKYAALLAKLRNIYITSLKGVVIPKTICSPIYPLTARVYRFNEMNRVVDII